MARVLSAERVDAAAAGTSILMGSGRLRGVYLMTDGRWFIDPSY